VKLLEYLAGGLALVGSLLGMGAPQPSADSGPTALYRQESPSELAGFKLASHVRFVEYRSQLNPWLRTAVTARADFWSLVGTPDEGHLVQPQHPEPVVQPGFKIMVIERDSEDSRHIMLRFPA
jgi:hypothetical protein